MAILNFNTGPAIDMNAAELARFNTLDTTPSSTNWSWITPDGTDIDLDGTGLTFDAAGHATGGTVNTVKIDVGNDDFANPNIEITGLNISATGLDFAPSVFWRAVLGGNDIISGPTVAPVGTTQTST